MRKGQDRAMQSPSDDLQSLRGKFSRAPKMIGYSMSRIGFIGPMLILIAATTTAASGATIHLKPAQGGNGSVVITLQGQIELGDEKKLVNAMLSYSDGTVILSSLGGSLVAGIEIGKVIRLKGFTTIVPDGITCASSCALAWLGGRVRVMGKDSKIGFHASYLRESGQVTSSGNALVGAYLNQLGLSSSAIIYLTKAPPSELQWLSEADAGRLGITVSLIDSKKYSAELGSTHIPPASQTTDLPAVSPRTQPAPTDMKTPEKSETDSPKTVPSSVAPKNGFLEPRLVKSVRVRPDGKPILNAEEPPAITGGLEPIPKMEGDHVLRAAILVGARKKTKDFKTYRGNVVWRLENTSRGPGQSLSQSVRAEADIPDARLKVTMLLQHNSDETLPASHLMTILFSSQSGGTFPAVDKIDIPQMRNEVSPSGDPLVGVPAKITNNKFLVGLARDATFQIRNIDLLKTRGWIDIALRFADGRIAKVTFEKGAAGDRAFSDFFDSSPAVYVPPSKRETEVGPPKDPTPRMPPAMWKELDAFLVNRFKKCWKLDARNLRSQYVPAFKVQFTMYGGLIDQPELLNKPSDVPSRKIADSALKAVKDCFPLKIPQKFSPFYGEWKSRILRFEVFHKGGRRLKHG